MWDLHGFTCGQPSTSGPKSSSHGSLHKGSFSCVTSEAEGAGYRLCHGNHFHCQVPSQSEAETETKPFGPKTLIFQSKKGVHEVKAQRCQPFWISIPSNFSSCFSLILPRLIFKHRPWGPSTALLRSGARAQLRVRPKGDWGQRRLLCSDLKQSRHD